jgi:MFS superfamily sulfate permease-like transporter
MSSVYLALWIYAGSVIVNIVAAVALAVLLALPLFLRKSAAARKV